MSIKTFRRGGIHPKGNKITAGDAIKALDYNGELTVILSQSIGAPSKPVVKVGDKVARGTMIAEAGGFVSAPLHSPIDAVVKKIDKVADLQGVMRDAIILEPLETADDAAMHRDAPLAADDLVKAIGDAGIVGLGGATFPTRVKLSIPDGKKAEYVIINGAECEPCLTCDDRLMVEHPDDIVEGALLIKQAVAAAKVIIGIEENKPEAIRRMTEVAAKHADVEVVTLKKKYPQGGEKQLIDALTRREVPEGGLPIEVGCVVDNVATAKAINDAVKHGTPLTDRVVTVTGAGLSNPGNFLVAIGTPVSRLIEAAGGLPETAGKVIAGGPMMGRAVSNLDAPSTKGLSGLTILPADESERRPEQPCIRCSRCVDVCPMGLQPYLFILLAKAGRWDDASRHGAMSCIECGSCSYICPSWRPLLDYIKLSKIELRKKPKN